MVFLNFLFLGLFQLYLIAKRKYKLYKAAKFSLPYHDNLDLILLLQKATRNPDVSKPALEDSILRTMNGHWNACGHLPPVNIPLQVLVDGKVVNAIRNEWAQTSEAKLKFLDLDQEGISFTGRYPWRYP